MRHSKGWQGKGRTVVWSHIRAEINKQEPGVAEYYCARLRKCLDGREKWFFRIRKVNAVYILEGLVKDYAFLEFF